MIPVTLVKTENFKGFLGSIDLINWWKSESIPGDVDTFTDAIWVYGQYHICSAKMMDGSYSIFQSKNNGVEWTEVLNTSEKINCLLRPDYGFAIAATSGGWWASHNSGTTWTKLSTQAPNCHTVKELTRSVLVALDGKYIWRSVDNAINWTKSVIHGTSIPVIAYTNYPTVDGTYNDCFVGCTSSNCLMTFELLGYSGPFSVPTMAGDIALSVDDVDMPYRDNLLFSDDGAESFTACEPDSGWALRESTYCISSNSYHSNVHFDNSDGYFNDGNGWQIGQYIGKKFYFKSYNPINLFPRNTYTDTITDIEMTGINAIGLPEFVIQVLKTDGTLRHYWTRRISHVASANKQLWVQFIFDAKSSLSDSLTSDETQVTGTNLISRFVYFSGTTTNSLPLLKRSIDGGEHWTDCDISNAVIYTGPDLTTILPDGNNPMMEDSYIKYSYSSLLCHNGWIPFDGYVMRNQSVDMGIYFKPKIPNEKPYSTDCNIANIANMDCSFDILNKIRFYESIILDILLKDDVLITYSPDILMEKEFPISFDMDIANAARKISELDIDSLVQKTCFPEMYPRMYLVGPNEKTYGMEMKLVDNHIDEIMNYIEKYTIQLPDIHYPDIPYKPVDFRTDGVTL